MSLITARMEALSRLLDVAAVRQDVIAQNIANVNTPGYQTLDVSFDQALQEQLTSQSWSIEPQIVAGTGGSERIDGNNVDIDQELARLQKNAILFKVYSQIIANELAQQRSAISGR